MLTSPSITKRLGVCLLVAVIWGGLAVGVHAQAIRPDAANEKIKALMEEMARVQAQKDEVQKTLDGVLQSKNSLNREIKTIDTNLNQLNLSIKANSLNTQKLGYEIQDLSQNIADLQDRLENQRITIAKLFVSLQERDRDTALDVILRNEHLSDGVSETKTIFTLNKTLADQIQELNDLQDQLNDRLAQAQNKKSEQVAARSSLVQLQSIVQDQKQEKQQLLSATKNQEKVYQQQINEINQRQLEISNAIEDIEHALRESFDPTLLPLKRHGVLALPIQGSTITQMFGATAFAEAAYRTKFHNGIDFAVSVGTPVYAAGDGIILAADNNDRGVSRWNRYQYGKYVLIGHDNNLATIYGHLSQYVAKKGQRVAKGDLIGYSGNTGYSYGPHVHFGVYWKPSVYFKSIPPAAGQVPVGVTINPADYLEDIQGIPVARGAR